MFDIQGLGPYQKYSILEPTPEQLNPDLHFKICPDYSTSHLHSGPSGHVSRQLRAYTEIPRLLHKMPMSLKMFLSNWRLLSMNIFNSKKSLVAFPQSWPSSEVS